MYCGSGELCTLVLRTQSYGDEWLEVLRSAKSGEVCAAGSEKSEDPLHHDEWLEVLQSAKPCSAHSVCCGSFVDEVCDASEESV